MSKTIQITTTLLGELTVPIEEGLFEDYTLPLGGKEVTFNMFIFENFLNEETAKITALFIDSIPLMYDKARKEITARAADSELIDYFFREGVAETKDEDYEDYLLELCQVDSREEITKEMFLAVLELRGLHIWQNKDGEVRSTLDFSLDEEYTDELLVISFNQALDAVDITSENHQPPLQVVVCTNPIRV
jgi:hypothetical protein